MTDEHPVLLAHRARPDVALRGVVVDRNPAVIQEGMHGTPLAEGVVERFAQPAFRADGGSAEAFERFSQQPDERPAAVMPHPRPDFGARSVVVEVALDPVERGDLLEDPGEDGGAFLERGLELAPDVGEAGGAADFLAAPGLEFAVVDVGLVGVAEQGALEVLAHPFGEVAVLAAGLPVEDDVAGQTAVYPEVALPAAAGDVPVEAAHGRLMLPSGRTLRARLRRVHLAPLGSSQATPPPASMRSFMRATRMPRWPPTFAAASCMVFSGMSTPWRRRLSWCWRWKGRW